MLIQVVLSNTTVQTWQGTKDTFAP